jgi:hypothetical protein
LPRDRVQVDERRRHEVDETAAKQKDLKRGSVKKSKNDPEKIIFRLFTAAKQKDLKRGSVIWSKW